MPPVIWTPAAEADLERIFLHIGQTNHSPQAAARVVRGMVAKAELYARRPLLAQERTDLTLEVRSFRVQRYVIFYQMLPQGIEILRIIHGSRDVARVFRSEEP